MRPDEAFNAAEWLVDRHVREGQGDRAAFFCGDSVLSYQDLQRETWRAAAMLSSLGVGPGERFLMVVADEPAFPAFFLGGLRLGAVPVPVSTMLRGAEVADLVVDSAARALVVSERFIDVLPAMTRANPQTTDVVVVDVGNAEPGVPDGLASHRWSAFAADQEIPAAATSAETVGFWLYTSGTTGKQKGAVHRHGDVRAVAETYGRTVLGIDRDDVCYSVAKLFFAFGLGNAMLFPLSVGASAVLDPAPPTPAGVAELATRHRPTLLFAPPGFCAALADTDLPGDAFASVRLTVTAGETLPAEVYRRFQARFGNEMLDGIGSTEVLHIFCSNHPGDVRPGSTGRPVSGYELRLLDQHGVEITEADVPGGLWVKGESITPGYWNRPEINAETFVDGWCRTGDVYRRDGDGYYWFVGRNSDMIKAGGIWVSPAEVESVLIEHPSVLEAAVVGGRTVQGLESTVAFVVTAKGCTIDVDELVAHCRERMAAFKRPREIHVIGELPKTPTGKTKRYALRESLRSGDATPQNGI